MSDEDWASCLRAGGNSTSLPIRSCTAVIDEFERALEKLVAAYNNRGVACRSNGEINRAIEDYNQAIHLKSDYYVAINNRGVAHMSKGDLDLAIADYDRVIQIKPDDIAAFYNRAVALSQKGILEKAIADYDGVIKVDPGNAVFLYQRGDGKTKKWGCHWRRFRHEIGGINQAGNFWCDVEKIGMIEMTFLRNFLNFDAIGEGRTMLIRLIHVLAIGLVALLFFSNLTFARGGLATNTWNPAHLDNLPPEIRAGVQRWEGACGGSVAAAQQFALYLTIPGTRFVALHYDDFRCRNKSAHCDVNGCLHEVYVATKGPYRRVLTIHAHDIRLLLDQNVALVEISGNSNGRARVLRWNGSRFVE